MTEHPTYGPPEVTMLANCAKQFRFNEQNQLTLIGAYDREKDKLDPRFEGNEAKLRELDKLSMACSERAALNGNLASQVEAFLAGYDLMRIERIARTAHEVIRAYDQSLGSFSIKPWDEAPEWQKESAINGVLFHLTNPDAGDAASHENWMREKLSTGWVWGPEKNEEKKTHHLLVPFDQLEPAQQLKDTLFRTTVNAAAKN